MLGTRHFSQPVEPAWRHVWVRASWDHGAPTAGVVADRQYTPVLNVNAADWLALVATRPFDDAL